MRARSFRGFTIVEMMVVCAVAIVILCLLVDVFIVALQRTQDSRLKVDMQQKAIFALNKWERDLEKTSARYLVIKPGDPYCVAMTQADRIDPNSGSVFWNEQLICWSYKQAQRIWERETYPEAAGGPSFAGEPKDVLPYMPTFAELDSLATHTSGQERIMCDNVEEFSFQGGSGGGGGGPGAASVLIQPFLFKLKLRRPLSVSERYAEFILERRYTLRNNF